MIHIQRKQPSNKANYILPLVIMAGVFGFSFFGSQFVSKISVANPETYMKLIPVAIIVLLVVIYGFTFATNPYFRGKRQEKKTFEAKHGKLEGAGYKWAMILSVAVALLPLVFVGSVENWKWFTENRTLVFGIWGAIGSIPVALFSFEMRRASARVISFANTQIPDTQLSLTDAESGKGGMLFSFDGDFRGRAVEYHSEVGGDAEGMGKTKCRVSTKQMPKEFADLHVTDRKPQWRSYKGNSVDDVFQQRFEVTGAEIADLPEEFKKVLVHMPRALRMEFHNNNFDFFYDATTEHAPFYSFHGLVLFLDDMSKIADSIA